MIAFFRPLVMVCLILQAGALAAVADSLVESAPGPRELVWQPKAGDVIHFDVQRNGTDFGSHIVSFEAGAPGQMRAIVDVDLKAGIGPITLYRYALDVEEVWQDGYVQSVEGRVNKDGTRKSVFAQRRGSALSVEGTDFRGELPGDIIPASHWNIAQMQADSILSTESGEVLDITVSALGREQVGAGGTVVDARKFLMDSDIDVTLWYDDQARWVKLAFEARGQNIEYVLRKLY